jgi:DNA repair ATPase RecN
MRHLVKKRQPAHVDGRSGFLTPSPVAVSPAVDRSKKKPLKIFFAESELAALAAVADERECSIQFWITSLVRARLTDGVSLGGAELKALGESLYQVTAIGRNLNQITHHINADPGKNLHRITERSIGRLLGVIEAHRVATHRVIEANTHRWKLA